MTTINDAIDYAKAVTIGDVVAGQQIIDACSRFLDDLASCDGKSMRFNRSAAQHILDWYPLAIRHVKGLLAGQPIQLEAWQGFILVNIFGFQVPAWEVDKLTGNPVLEDGEKVPLLDAKGQQRWVRRYRTAYIEVARKNAKSTLSSGIGLYMAGADGEGGAEVYSAATTRDQARIVFDDAKNMIKKSPVLKRLFGVHKLNIHQLDSASKFEPLSADADSLDGLNVHCAIVDEIHAHKQRDVWDVIETATGAREQPLLVGITTAGSNKHGICYELRTYGTKILNKTIEDDTFFAAIYTLDDGDDWQDEANWPKANPNIGVSVKWDDIRRLAKKAKEMPTARNNFLTKRLNVWVNAESAWLNMEAWDKSPARSPLSELELVPCWVGLDLANKLDVAAAIALFRNGDKYEIECKFWLPEESIGAVSKTQGNLYSVWAEQGFITLTEGSIIDHERIADDLREWLSLFQIKEVPFDPWGSTQLALQLSKEGAPMVEVGQTTKNLSEAMKEVEALVISGRFAHGNNPVMSWMMGNVVAKVDANENVFPRKEHPDNKIDGPVALFTAMNRALASAEEDLGDFLNNPMVF